MSRWSIAKLIELLIAAACLFLHQDYLKSDQGWIVLCSVTFVGYTFLLLLLLVGYFISKPFSRRVDIIFGILAIPLFFASGYFILHDQGNTLTKVGGVFSKSTYDNNTLKGWLSIANGVVFILDIVFHCFE